MKWKKYTIYTTTEAEDLVSLMLNENGVEGVQIENNVPLSEADTKGMFIDILPEIGEDDGRSRVSFFLHLKEEDGSEGGEAGRENAVPEPDMDHGVQAAQVQGGVTADGEDRSYTITDRLWTEEEISDLLQTVRAELEEMRAYANVGDGRIEEGTTEDTDWRDNWKQYFKPILIGNYLVKPSWEPVPEELGPRAKAGELKVIEIDPGTAFGTGSHETTQLCLESIEEFTKTGDSVLDIGTGSGILGIAALKTGAGRVTATELDEMCAPSIHDNVGFNEIPEDAFHLIIGNVLGDTDVIRRVHDRAPEGFDLVIANILAPVIVMLAAEGAADAFCRKGGIFITSGIIDTKLSEVKAAFEANPNWKIRRVKGKGEWTSVVAERI